MSEWKKVKLGEVSQYVNDKIAITVTNESYYVSTDSMLKDRGGVIPPESIPSDGNVTRYQRDDILVSNIRPYFKKIWFSCREGGCSNDVLVFRAIEGVTSRYLYYILSSDTFFEHMMAGANGTKMPRGNKKLILNYSFELPSLPTQHRIATVLSRYDSLIENYQKQIKLLEEAAQRLYKEWFVDLHFPGHENTKIVDGVPEGWEKKKVGSMISKIQRTKQVPTADYKNAGWIPVIDQSRNYIAGYTDDVECCIKMAVPAIVFGDHTRVFKYIPFPFAKGADGTQIIVSKDSERMPQSLFYTSLLNVDLSNYSYARHFKYLKEEEIVVPTQLLAMKYDKIVSVYYKTNQTYRDQIRLLTEARDRLLPKLMSGEIKI